MEQLYPKEVKRAETEEEGREKRKRGRRREKEIRRAG